MELGHFMDRGRRLVGRIGCVELAWDRHAGGRLFLAHVAGHGTVPVCSLTLIAKMHGTTVNSVEDPHPRLIPVEEGPYRIALRAAQRLADPSGRHVGEAMQESWSWADGDVYLNAMMRLVGIGPSEDIGGFEARLTFADGWRSTGGPSPGLARFRHESGIHAAVTRYGDGSAWAIPVAGADPWEGLDGQPPYYRRWGPYYDQWGGQAGWAEWQMDTPDGSGPEVRASFNSPDCAGPQPAVAVRGTLAVLLADSVEQLDARARAFEHPVIPEVSGGRVLYHSPMDGTVVIRKEREALDLTYPPGEKAAARVLVCGADGRQVLAETTDSGRVPFPLTDGGASDDPNGPDLLRPDDPHGLILTDEHVRPDEVLIATDLTSDAETRVRLSSVSGIQMSCQRWDDRRNLLLFSSTHPQGSLLSLSLRDLKARQFRILGQPAPVMARLPLYWFQANASSAHHCLNVLDRFDLIQNGPERVRFSVRSHNPARTARSEVDVTVPYLEDRLQLDLVCRFRALDGWDLPGIQYCNFFPEETRDPAAWNADRVLVMAGDGQWMRIDPRAETGEQVRGGARFSSHEGALFVALYGGPAGNTFALARPSRTAGAGGGYQLCGCWLDNHLYLSGSDETIPSGTEFEVPLTLVMAQTSNVDSDMEEMGRRALATGGIDLDR